MGTEEGGCCRESTVNGEVGMQHDAGFFGGATFLYLEKKLILAINHVTQSKYFNKTETTLKYRPTKGGTDQVW